MENEAVSKIYIFLLAAMITLMIVVIRHKANLDTREDMRRSINVNMMDDKYQVYTPIEHTRESIRISWPDCPVPFFIWKLDRLRNGDYRLTYVYQVSTYTTVRTVVTFSEKELWRQACDDSRFEYPAEPGQQVMTLVSHCRFLMEQGMRKT